MQLDFKLLAMAAISCANTQCLVALSDSGRQLFFSQECGKIGKLNERDYELTVHNNVRGAEYGMLASSGDAVASSFGQLVRFRRLEYGDSEFR